MLLNLTVQSCQYTMIGEKGCTTEERTIMFFMNTRQLKVKDVKSEKYKYTLVHGPDYNDMADFEVDENGDLIIITSYVETAWLWNVDDANGDIFEAIERLGVSDNAKIFAKNHPDVEDDKIYKVIDFMVDEQQSDPHEAAYSAVHTVVRK